MLTTHQPEGVTSVERLDDHPIPNSYSEIRLFAKVRNEAERLPYFLAYYRTLGVNRFFIIDNCSNDHTVDILRENDDCHLFQQLKKWQAHALEWTG